MAIKGITLTAIFSKATTTIDGGWNLTLSVDQGEAQKIMQLTELRQSLLQVAFVPIDAVTSKKDRDLEL